MAPHRRLRMVLCLLAIATCAIASPPLDPANPKPDPDGTTLWYDARAFGIEGQGWTDTLAPYDRLPAKAEKVVRPEVWGHSRFPSGMCVRFVADATTLQARWTLTSDRLGFPNTTPTTVSGLDLYARSAESGHWRWLGIGRALKQTNTDILVKGLPPGQREFLLYLPLYNSVSSLEIGVPKTSQLAKAPERPADRRKPIVFYGTSITHGKSASRPGMVHTAILGRKFDRPFISLGFSGEGKMDAEIGRLLVELDPAVYIIDCAPNMDGKLITERTEPFVRLLRETRPRTPILLVEDRSYANAEFLPVQRQRNIERRTALHAAYEKLRAAGVPELYYLRGDKLIGEDGEGTSDGSHPNDLGFMRQAEAFAKVLQPILAGSRTATGQK